MEEGRGRGEREREREREKQRLHMHHLYHIMAHTVIYDHTYMYNKINNLYFQMRDIESDCCSTLESADQTTSMPATLM